LAHVSRTPLARSEGQGHQAALDWQANMDIQ